MQNYVFMTDSDSDLPLELKQQYDIPVVYMPYSLDGKEYFDDLGQSLNHKSFYDKMRAGSQPTTSALNETVYMEYFEPILSSGRDLLFAAFSSQLSATIQAIYAAREELLKQYRNASSSWWTRCPSPRRRRFSSSRRMKCTARANRWRKSPSGWRTTSSAHRLGSQWMT